MVANSCKVYLDGYHGDTSETFLVGEVDEVGQHLVETARRCRDEAIAACKPGTKLCVIGNTIRYTLIKKNSPDSTNVGTIPSCPLIFPCAPSVK